LDADKPICRRSGELIPTIILSERIDQKLYQNYLSFKLSKSWIPCEKQIQEVPSFIINSTIDKLLLERLERKSESIIKSLKLNNNNWEETFYQHLARNFGFKTNAEPFELLAKSLPSIVLAKHKSSLLQIEALLFGQAGMLDKHFEDKYSLELQNEYAFLKQKFKLHSIEEHLWKFMRMRPVNFPSIRIAQFANLVYTSSHLFSKTIDALSIDTIKNLLNGNVSEYWETHYVFGKESKRKQKHLGENAVNTIIINTIVPFLFVYGKQRSEQVYIDRALSFLELVNGDQNNQIERWSGLGIPVNNAYATQALLQLKNEYCDFRKCLNCTIGNYLLKKV
jgi:hypothetical protein